MFRLPPHRSRLLAIRHQTLFIVLSLTPLHLISAQESIKPISPIDKSETSVIKTDSSGLSSNGIMPPLASRIPVISPDRTIQTGYSFEAPRSNIAPISGLTFPNPSHLISSERPADKIAPLANHLEDRVAEIEKTKYSDTSGNDTNKSLETLYSNAGKSKGAEDDIEFFNDNVELYGRGISDFEEVVALVKKYDKRFGGPLDLSDTLNVIRYQDGVTLRESIFQDTYAAIWAKFKIIDALVGHSRLSGTNLHIPLTLKWVDGYEIKHVPTGNGQEKRPMRTVFYTHRVYFHPSANRQSNIDEGNRRLDKFLEEVQEEFKSGGPVEKALGAQDRVILGFDTQDYKEIKDYLKAKEQDLTKAHGDRFHFVFLDDIAPARPSPEDIRKDINDWMAKYQQEKSGLVRVGEGVAHGRWQGGKLELQTLAYLHENGHSILESGKDLFDENGNYATEIDAFARKNGKMTLYEVKSAIVELPSAKAAEEKVLYKLRAYRKYRELIRAKVAKGSDFKVTFVIGLGMGNAKLRGYLMQHRKRWGREYGFSLDFIFVEKYLAPDNRDGVIFYYADHEHGPPFFLPSARSH